METRPHTKRTRQSSQRELLNILLFYIEGCGILAKESVAHPEWSCLRQLHSVSSRHIFTLDLHGQEFGFLTVRVNPNSLGITLEPYGGSIILVPTPPRPKGRPADRVTRVAPKKFAGPSFSAPAHRIDSIILWNDCENTSLQGGSLFRCRHRNFFIVHASSISHVMLSHWNILLVKKRLAVAAPHLFHLIFFSHLIQYLVVRHGNVFYFIIHHSTLQFN